ncbi:MAG: nucleotide exchange factor GrpE [Candidatus Undinarchaeales archaeon]|jgi:molecular chaperone GrpE|nr:nucleotide exchange factor GrpE [Candidatus Undinarchaeales archaeon]MDP7493524.1 nucleotide exchange factor GrpE [Candidatus Undinarchaeales archaeon]
MGDADDEDNMACETGMEPDTQEKVGPKMVTQDGKADTRIEDLRNTLDEHERESKEQLDRLVRVQADFDNFRKRVERDRDDLAKTAAEGLILRVLEVVDNLDRAIEHMRTDERTQEHTRGVEMIKDQLLGVLAVEGLQEMECLDKPFDPLYHEAIARETMDDVDAETVSEVFQKGYTLKGKVIRHARVKVTVPVAKKEGSGKERSTTNANGSQENDKEE